MKMKHTPLAMLIVAALFAPPAIAQTQADHHSGDLARLGVADDPFVPVYIVTSRALYDKGIKTIARNGIGRRDSLGNGLVIAEIQAHQLSDLSRHVHESEKRCGGYFAFSSRAQADAFIVADRSLDATGSSFLASYTIDNQATVSPWLTTVSEGNIHTTISHLSGYRNRYYTSSYGKASAEWIRSSWQQLAGTRTDVTTELFNCSNCSTQPSVILTVQGTDLANEIVVLGAHLDSINGSANGSNEQVAPGADDDASGIATLTEVMRVALASGWKPRRTVKFMGYAAEEVGLRGSSAIAQSFKSANRNVVGVMQLDMTNYKSGAVADMQLVTDYSNADMKTFLVNLFDAYLAPLGLTRSTYTCGYGCSDHASWTTAGYPSAMMFEAGDAGGSFSKIHTANDTLANMNSSAANSVKFAKLGLAFLGELGKTGSAPGNAAPVANFSAAISGRTVTFTDSSTDSDGSIASRSWNFGDGTSSTATNPSKTYAADGSYTAVLTVTDNAGATATKSLPVVIGTTGGGGDLVKAVPKTGLSGAAGSYTSLTMAVPTGATNLSFTMSGGTGDADMYVKAGSAPTDTVYDCRPYKSGNAEACTFAAPAAGTYYVRIKGYSAFSGVSLVGDYTPAGGGGGSAQTYSNTVDYAIKDNTTVDSPILVSGRAGSGPISTPVAVNIVHTYKGDLKVDLVAPDGSLYNIHNRSGGSADNVVGTVNLNLSSEALNGTWKLRVNDNGAGDTGYINSWSITF